MNHYEHQRMRELESELARLREKSAIDEARAALNHALQTLNRISPPEPQGPMGIGGAVDMAQVNAKAGRAQR